MQSLTVHFRQVEGHDRLPFHPSCPICRQTRLTGTLGTGVVSPRTQALLAAGVLALPVAAPVPAAFAAEQDQQQEGTAPVAESAPTDPAGRPDFDPGGDATDLPEAAAPPVPQAQAPVDVGADDSAPVEETPATNPAEPVVDPGDGSDAPPTPQPAAPQGTTSPDTSAAPPPAQSAPETTSGPAPAPTASPDAPAPAVAPPPAPDGERVKRSVRRANVRATPPSNSAIQAAPSGTVAAAPVAVAAVPAAVTRSRGDRTKPGDHAHRVLAGESLWSIASDLLGPEATPAAVAREVHRLWRLNRDRIGTGDPDLLMIGTRLTLR